jgi:hypothetical protein
MALAGEGTRGAVAAHPDLAHGVNVVAGQVVLPEVADAHGTGAVGVQLSHSIHRDKLALASSLQSTSRRGWQRGRLGLPYFVSGRGDAERRGWVITMHGAGTAIRPGGDPARPLIKPTIRMRST